MDQRTWLSLKAAIAWLALKIIGATLRFQVVGRRYQRQMLRHPDGFIYALWHGRMFLPLYSIRNPTSTVLVSKHRDGELLKWVLTRLGHKTVRGSTTSGGINALKMLLQEKKGTIFVITPDGPKGPAKKAQPGVIFLAQHRGIPILPVSGAAKRCKFFNSWDKFMLPLPFSKVVLAFGRPIFVKPGLSQTEFPQECLNLEQNLNRITEMAEKVCGCKE